MITILERGSQAGLERVRELSIEPFIGVCDGIMDLYRYVNGTAPAHPLTDQLQRAPGYTSS